MDAPLQPAKGADMVTRGFLVDGLVGIDLRLDPAVTVQCHPKGLALWHSCRALSVFVPTDSAPAPGMKVTVSDDSSIPALRSGPFVVGADVGGGAVRTAVALAHRSRAQDAGGSVVLFHSGTDVPELGNVCTRAGIVCYSLGRQTTPINLVVPAANLTMAAADRIIVKSRTSTAPAHLNDAQRRAVARTSGQAQAVITVSSKDGALTAAAVASGNGAQRYFQPTGSLSPEMTQLLLLTVNDVVANLDEWCRLGRDAGMAVPEVSESEPDAPKAAAHLLRDLHRLRWGGQDAAVVTVGRGGVIVADWASEQIYHVGLDLADGDLGIPTPAGAGDGFLAEWVRGRERSRQRHLRQPLVDTAQEAVVAVAGALGLGPARYTLRTTQLSSGGDGGEDE